MTSSISFGAPVPKSIQGQALEQIDYRDQPFANKDFVRNMQWLNESVTSLSQYTQLLQKGVDSANNNILEQIQSFAADLFLIFAGFEPTGVDIGDLAYVMQGLGAMLGINPDTPFPFNLAEAAWHMFSNFIVPLPQFTDLIFDAILAWAETLGFSEAAVDSIQEFSDAVVSLYNGIEDTFGVIGDIVTTLLKAFGLGTGGMDLSGLRGFWDSISGFLDNILEGPHELLMNILSNIVVFIFKSLTWLTNLVNPKNLWDSIGMRFVGPQLVPDVSDRTEDWTVGSNINTGWVFDGTVTHKNLDQINSGINTGWWTVPHYTVDGSLGSFKTVGNSVNKRVLTQGTVECVPGQSYFVSGYLKFSSVPSHLNTFGPCIVFYNDANEVSQTNVNVEPHGATEDWGKTSQVIVVPNNVNNFRVGARVSSEINSGTIWVDDLSCTGEQPVGAGIAQGILDFPRNLVSGIIDYIDGIVTFFFGENNILSKVLASIIPGLDATVITTGQFAQEMVQGLGDAFNSVWEAINGAIDDLGQLIHDLWYDPIGTIGQIGQNMVDGLTTALSNLGTGISNLVTDLGQLLYDLWHNPAEVIANIIASMIPGLDASKITSGQLAQEMVSGLTTAISDLVTGVNSALENLGQLIYDLWHNPIEVLANLTAVMIPGLDASKITSGQYAMEMVEGLNDALSNLGNWVQDVIDAVIGAITGIPIIGGVVQGIIDGVEDLFDGLFGQPTPAATLAAQAVPALDASKIQTGEVAADRIAALDASKIGTGQFGTTRIADNAIVDAKISDLSGTKINTGTVAANYVGALDASKIQSGQFQNAQIATGLDASKLTTGTLPIDRVADSAITNTKIAAVDAGKLTTGTLPIDRVANNAITNAKINDLSGSKINAGSVAANYIAALDASKIQTGTLDPTRLPAEITTVGSGLTCLRTTNAGTYTTLWKSGVGERLPTGFYDSVPSNTSDLQIVSEYIDSANRIGCKTLNPGWYMAEIGYELHGGADLDKFNYSWNLSPGYWLKRAAGGTPDGTAPYKFGTSGTWLCFNSALQLGWGSDFAQSSFIVYMYANDILYPGYKWTRTDSNKSSDTIIKASTYGDGFYGTYFSMSLLNRSLA